MENAFIRVMAVARLYTNTHTSVLIGLVVFCKKGGGGGSGGGILKKKRKAAGGRSKECFHSRNGRPPPIKINTRELI